MSFLHKEIKYLRHIFSTKGIRPKTAKQVCAFLRLIRYYSKFIRNFTKMAKPLTLLTCQKAKFEWTPMHHTTFLTVEESVTQAPILHYPDPTKCYIVYTNASDRYVEHNFHQEYDGMEFPITFLLHTFMDTQKKWSTTEQEAYGIYYAVTKWNCYLQGAAVIVHNGHKPLARFLNGKSGNNKVNRWALELAVI